MAKLKLFVKGLGFAPRASAGREGRLWFSDSCVGRLAYSSSQRIPIPFSLCCSRSGTCTVGTAEHDDDGPLRQARRQSLSPRPAGGCRVGDQAKPTDHSSINRKGPTTESGGLWASHFPGISPPGCRFPPGAAW